MRLNRFLAAAGLGSRRYCDELIAAGRVTINGRVCTDFSAQPAERDHVKVDGKLVHSERRLDIMLHKPAGFVSTRDDPHARDTIFDLLPPHLPRLFNIGRLDAQTEGLLVLTNNGGQQLTWSLTKGSPPPGVTLFPSGLLMGTPEGTGNFVFTASVTSPSGLGPQANQDATSQTFQIGVRPSSADLIFSEGVLPF